MELQPSTAPLPPLLAEVRRRHPDVDIVVLPEEVASSAARTRDEVGDTEVAAARQRVDEEAAGLGDLADCALAPAVLRPGPARGTVRARSRSTSVRTDGADALHLLDSGLSARGWSVRRPPGGPPRLLARTRDVEVSASWSEPTGVLVVEVSSGSLLVGEARARTLVRR